MAHDRGEQIGFAVMSKQDGEEWGRRQTIRAADHDQSNLARGLLAAKSQSERALSSWQRIDPDKTFKIIPWHYNDNRAWANGSFDARI